MNAQEYYFIQEKSSLPRTPIISRMDYDANGLLIYSGLAKRGSATSDAAWLIEKYFYIARTIISISQNYFS